MRFDRAVGVEEQYPHRAVTEPPVVITSCTHGQVYHAVTIKVTQRSHRCAEIVNRTQSAGETALGVADLLVRFDRAVGVEEQYPHRAMSAPPVVIAFCPDGQIANAIAVEITQRGHPGAEVVVLIQDAGEATLGVTDLLMCQDGARLGVGVLPTHHGHRENCNAQHTGL